MRETIAVVVLLALVGSAGAVGAEPCHVDADCAGDACHLDGTCDVASGVCTNAPQADGTPCDDRDACTRTDRCLAGMCTGADRIVCVASDQCHDAGTCDPASGVCSNPAKADGTPCDDGNACTRIDTCQLGSCTGTDPIVCSAPDDCHDAGACDPDSGACSTPARPDGSRCDDGNACTAPDVCDHGVCTGTPAIVCPLPDGCHEAGTCDPRTGRCTNRPRQDGASCDDANACTVADRCRAGVCVGTIVPGCCVDDSGCDDGVACTDDRCVRHVCAHVAVDARCGPAADCTAVACAPGDPAADASGCVAHPLDDDGFCLEDGDPCTTDVCTGGACRHVAGAGIDCEAIAAPLQTTLALMARAGGLRDTVATAAAASCPAISSATSCTLVSGKGSVAPRLVALLDGVHGDLQATALTLGGRLPGSSPPDAVLRARLAIGLLTGTPGKLRAFIATAAQARGRHLMAKVFARTEQDQARALLRATVRLRAGLRRLVLPRRSFAR